MRKTKKPAVTVERPFETDYAGLWKGHCKTRESAITAAQRRVVYGAGKCTITDMRTGEVVARITTRDRRRTMITKVTDPLLELFK
jgi:hypothetical protein